MDSLQQFHFSSNGLRFHVRPIKPSDKKLFQRGFSELSERSRYLRFFTIDSKLSDYQLNYFTNVDGINHVAWGMLDETGDEPKPVGVGRFVRLKDKPETAEVAITLVDAYQRKGLGRVLFSVVNIVAARIGVKKLRFFVLKENSFFLNFLKHFDFLNQETEGRTILVDTKVIPNHKEITKNPKLESFIAIMKKTEEFILRQIPYNQEEEG